MKDIGNWVIVGCIVLGIGFTVLGCVVLNLSPMNSVFTILALFMGSTFVFTVLSGSLYCVYLKIRTGNWTG